MATPRIAKPRIAKPSTQRRYTPRRANPVRGVIFAILFLFVIAPLAWVGIYRVVGPPITFLMIERMLEGRGLDHKWIPISRIAPSMTRAVIASEDANFCSHHGFDLHAIDAALQHNAARPGKIRGGSTISQQTAKNVFLWPERSWLRKGAEAYFTVLIEKMWGKRRIMEVYLNTVEMGPGIYGVESASERYYGISAQDLSASQASRLAAVLPDPLKWQVVRPGPYVRRRTGKIDAREDTVARGGLAACVFAHDDVDALFGSAMGDDAVASGAKPRTSAAAAEKAEAPDRFIDPYPNRPSPTSSDDTPSVPPPAPSAPGPASVPPQPAAPAPHAQSSATAPASAPPPHGAGGAPADTPASADPTH